MRTYGSSLLRTADWIMQDEDAAEDAGGHDLSVERLASRLYGVVLRERGMC